MTNMSYVHISLELWGFIFCTIAAVCSLLEKEIDPRKNRLLFGLQIGTALLLFFDAFAWIFRGNTSVLGFYMVRISNFFVFVIGALLMMIFTAYLMNIIGRNATAIDLLLVRGIYILSAVYVLSLVISQFTGLYYAFDASNHYYRTSGFWMSQAIGILGMIVDAMLLLRHRREMRRMEFVSLLSYIILPALAMVIQIFVYGIALLNMAITVSVLLLFANSLIEFSRRMVEQEREISQAKLDVFVSQIQPHFLFNSLTTIRHLCKKDTELAVDTIDEFSAFLRACTDSVNRKTCITFDHEMDIVNHYLYLEKQRFGDKLQITYDLQATGFEIPAFTVQPIAENAVKHGLMEKPEGGTLHIASREEADDYLVIIEDDGVGFDWDEVSSENEKEESENSRSMVGIVNVKTRIDLMVSGKVEIISKTGEGTRVEIRIPKMKQKTR